LRRLAIVLLLIAVLAAACSGGDADVARVGDTTIRYSDMQALYETEQPVDSGFLETLFAKIAFEALTQALNARYQVTVDPADVETYYTQFSNAIASQEGATAADLLGVENASMEMVRFNAELAALRDTALESLVRDPAIADPLFTDPKTLTNVCAKHILLATEEEADTVLARLQAGEDFATVAGEVSTDTNSEGGDLGCTLAGDYVEPFAQAVMDAPLNELYGPIETEFGWHVLMVTERTTGTRAEYDADPWSVISSSRATLIWSDWITAVLADADVWLADSYGTWTPTGIEGPSTTTTVSPFSTTTSGG
jgi:parvulin-like peptidyl-prolyl isomerase